MGNTTHWISEIELFRESGKYGSELNVTDILNIDILKSMYIRYLITYNQKEYLKFKRAKESNIPRYKN